MSEKLQDYEPGGRQSYWATSIGPWEGVIGFCRSSTMARRQRQRPGRKPAHPAPRGVHSHAVRSMARTRTGSISTR
jgi:hypothetical protein